VQLVLAVAAVVHELTDVWRCTASIENRVSWCC